MDLINRTPRDLGQLPNDLWYLIFDNLETNDIASCYCVCWEWIEIVQHCVECKPIPIHLCEEDDLKMLTNRITSWPWFLWFNSLSHQGERLLSTIQSQVDSIQVISLHNCHVSDDLIQSLCVALVNSDIMLQDLLLSSNSISDIGLDSLSKLTSKTSLVCLDLHQNNFTAKGVSNLAQSLKNNSTLEYLVLDENQFGDEGAIALGEILESNQGLRELSLADTSITSLGLKSIADSLATNRTLGTLVLDTNHIGDSGVGFLSSALTSNRSLQSLHLNECSITDIGVEHLGKGLMENSTLTDLQISFNSISSIQPIVEVLKISKSLQIFHLDENELSQASLSRIPEMISFGSLKVLGISNVGVKSEAIPAILDAISSNTAFSGLRINQSDIGPCLNLLGQFLLNNTTILGLSLSEMRGHDVEDLHNQFQNILIHNKTLKWLNLSGNIIGDYGATKIATGLKHNTVLDTLDLSCCDIGNEGVLDILCSMDSSLHNLILQGNLLNDDSVDRLTTFINKNTSLQLLDLRTNLFSKKGLNRLETLCDRPFLRGVLREVLIDSESNPLIEDQEMIDWEWLKEQLKLAGCFIVLLGVVLWNFGKFPE